MAQRKKATPEAARRRRLMREVRSKVLGVREPPVRDPLPRRRRTRGKVTGLPETVLRAAAKKGLSDDQIKSILRQRTKF